MNKDTKKNKDEHTIYLVFKTYIKEDKTALESNNNIKYNF